MHQTIKLYNYKDAATISEFLLNYRDILDYRHLFASKEWLLSFLEIYKPKKNFLIQSENKRNYFSLSELNDQLIFTGDPFNDFNGVFISDSMDQYDFKNIIWYFLKLGYRINWVNLFESHLLEELSKNGELQEGVVGLKILRGEKPQNYNNLVSNRIRRMYERFSKNLIFFRMFGTDFKNDFSILKKLLFIRRFKLWKKKREEYNPSFEEKFDQFIINVISFDSIWKNFFIDYCLDKNNGNLMAATFNFIKDGNVICYLRAHAPSRNTVSYGLILDYWSINKNFYNNIKIIDLSRGDESYKYRLGAIEYKLNNFVII